MNRRITGSEHLTGDDYVHLEGATCISNATLCGYVDVPGVTETRERANCPGCLAVLEHALKIAARANLLPRKT